MQRANRVVAVSQFAANIAREILTDVPMEVIYNGIDTQQFRPPPVERTPHQPFRLLYVGSWMARKGVDLLAPIMRELGEGFELRYTGGPAAERDKRDMPTNMHDLGRLQGADAVVAAMHDADMFLFPSRSEGFPLVAIEAMACGLPLIASRNSSLAEAVEDRASGILCMQENTSSMAAACRELAGDQATYLRMAATARARVHKNLTIGRMVDRYTQTYASVTSTVVKAE